MEAATAARPSILLVEDDAAYAELVGEGLRDAWRGPVEVVGVSRLRDAQRHLAETGADCVLLDLSLPDAEGLDVLAGVMEMAPSTPVVVLTGREGDVELGERAVRLGAQDYLVKSRAGDELLARTARYAIERKQGELERMTLEARVTQESLLSRALQRGLVPELPDVAGVSMGARYEPSGLAGQVGGDWYDVISLEDGRVAAVVGDVVGHGFEAAATMGQIATAVRAYALADPEPRSVVDSLNHLVARFVPDEMTTLVYALIDPRERSAAVTSAGHPPGVLLREEGGPELVRGGRGTPLGWPSPAAEPAMLNLARGDTLLLYTDGLIERRGEDLNTGLERLLAECATVAGLGPEQIPGALGEALTGTSLREDDLAALAVRVDRS